MGRRWLVLVAALLLASCGRKLPPLPPIVEVPETTTDLTVFQQENDIVLTWSYPSLTRAGRALTDLQRVGVWRLDLAPGQELPASPALRQQLILTRGKVVGRLEGASLEEATRGSKLRYVDPIPAVTGGASPPTYWYAVRSRRRDGTVSALSNLVSWKPKPVPAQVRGVKAEPTAGGISLTWEAVQGASYLVERHPENGGAWEAVSPPSLTATAFVDSSAAQGATWRYRVRAVVDEVRGPASAEEVVSYPDIYPSTPPSALVCLPEEGKVRLSWEASPDAGVTYRVRRRSGGGSWEVVREGLHTTSLVDEAVPAGVLEYQVTAVDAAGNESAATTCTTRAGS
jgi:fibronectin type 3 domain-containing protein